MTQANKEAVERKLRAVLAADGYIVLNANTRAKAGDVIDERGAIFDGPEGKSAGGLEFKIIAETDYADFREQALKHWGRCDAKKWCGVFFYRVVLAGGE